MSLKKINVYFDILKISEVIRRMKKILFIRYNLFYFTGQIHITEKYIKDDDIRKSVLENLANKCEILLKTAKTSEDPCMYIGLHILNPYNAFRI